MKHAHSIPLILIYWHLIFGNITGTNREQQLKQEALVSQYTLDDLEKYYWEIYVQNRRLLAEIRDNIRRVVKKTEFEVQLTHILEKPTPRAENMQELIEVNDDSTTEPLMEIVETPIHDAEYDEVVHVCTSDKIIIENLLQKYKTYKTPSEEGVVVWIEVWVQEVNSVNEITSDFDMDIYVTELWIDQALKYENMNPCKYNLSLNKEILDHIWKPNTVFINSKSAMIHKSPFPNVFLMVYPNGTVWVNYRVQVKGPCLMDFTSFPMDEQTCLLTFESFNYNNQEVDMQWISTKTPLILLKDQITLPDFVLSNYTTSIAKVTYPAGVWNELTMTFTFTRRYGWYIFQAYVPTYLTIFISWISFCLGVKMIPARTMLGVNSLLALTFQFGNIMRNLPRVSYIKALDVWMLSCLSFVFCSLLELAIVGSINAHSEVAAVNNPLKKHDIRSLSLSAAQKPQSLTVCPKEVEDSPNSHSISARNSPLDPCIKRRVLISPYGNHRIIRSSVERRRSSASCCNKQEQMLLLDSAENTKSQIRLQKPHSPPQHHPHRWTADRIDHLSVLLFPSLFAVFNIIYWSYYLSSTR